MVAKISTILGARPQFIKSSLVSQNFNADPRIEETIIHTGQHFDRSMSDIFFKELAIPEPAINLNIKAQSHGQMTGQMIAAIETELLENQPELVLVYGDTNTTLAGSLAAVKLKIPVAHVEAGLRSRSFFQPEEINRRVTDHLSRLLLCPTARAVDVLASEGLIEGVHNVGDVMYDLALFARKHCPSLELIRNELNLPKGNYQVATIH